MKNTILFEQTSNWCSINMAEGLVQQRFEKVILFSSTLSQFVIHLIEKALSLEKYKPWTMGPNGLIGRTLLALQI